LTIRECAGNCEPYVTLKNAYDNRAASVKKIKDTGKKVVWTFSGNVPDEVIYAAGMIPIRAWGSPAPWEEADRYLELSFGPVWRALFDTVMNGKYRDLMDGLVFSTNFTMLEKMYNYLRWINDREPERNLPPIALIDYEVMERDYLFFDRNCKNTEEFAREMEAWSGTTITDEALRNAISLYNEYRQALRDFLALRKGEDSRITGSEALTVVGATLVMEKERCIPLLRALTQEAAKWPIVDGVRLFYTGSQQENTELYRMIEGCGGNVVGEDHDWGDRVADLDIKDTLKFPLDCITERYWYLMPNSEKSRVKLRAELVPEWIRTCGAEAFLVYMYYNDEAYFWDYPTQKKKLDTEKIPSHLIAKQRIPLVNSEELRDELGQFIASVRREN